MPTTFAEWLGKYLEDNRLSYEQFGELVGKSHGAVGSWVRGKYEPDGDTLQKVAEATHTDISYLAHLVFGWPIRESADEQSERSELVRMLAGRLSRLAPRQRDALLRLLDEFEIG